MFGLGIVAHEQRMEMIGDLVERLHNVDVLNIDDGSLKCEGNHLYVLNQLLMSRHRGYDWTVVLEDDALPVLDFEKYAEAALTHAPAPVVGFYLGSGSPGLPIQRTIRAAVVEAEQRNSAWIVADCLIGSVGYAVRTDRLKDMLEFISADDQTEELPLRISRWTQARGEAVAYTQPSLVQHADVDSVGYTFRGPYYSTQAARTAWRYGARDNWETPPVQMGHCGKWSVPLS